jgi:hypothetical protein
MKIHPSILALMAATAMTGCIAETAATSVKPEVVECDGSMPPEVSEQFVPDEPTVNVAPPDDPCLGCGMG